MQLSDEALKELRTTFELVVKKARQCNVSGTRAEGRAAWWSEQRDISNHMPNIVQAAAAIADCTMSEEEKQGVQGEMAGELLVAVQGEQGGVLTIPSIIDRHMQNNPEETVKFMSLLGYAVMFIFAALPASSVNPEGLMESDIKSDVVLMMAMSHVSEDTRNEIYNDLKEWQGELAAPFAFSEWMQDISRELSRILENGESSEE